MIEGTIAENIARFDPDPPAAAVIAAARAAGVHDLVVNLPAGYETQIGERGTALSAGQQQRIALARALYGDPFLVVLDEPNSNLDAEGEEALTNAILGVRARGGIVVVVAHRSSALAAVDYVLAMMRGGQQAFGPKEEVARLARREPAVPGPPRSFPRATDDHGNDTLSRRKAVDPPSSAGGAIIALTRLNGIGGGRQPLSFRVRDRVGSIVVDSSEKGAAPDRRHRRRRAALRDGSGFAAATW